MNYQDFYKQWSQYGCFNINQIYAWSKDFNRHNLRYWVNKGYILKLRNEWYAFADRISVPDFPQYIANRIYRPSYISLQTALSHYGLIPEGVMQITSVTTLKTERFSNAFGEFFYQSIKPDMMFGYESKTMTDGRAILFATPEKALFDFLYLNPYYNTEADMLNLRLDEDFMADDFNPDLICRYAESINNSALNNRIHTLLKAYDS